MSRFGYPQYDDHEGNCLKRYAQPNNAPPNRAFYQGCQLANEAVEVRVV